MNCPYCGSTHLEESSNFNEYSCNFCKCEFKNDGEKFRIFEEGNYIKFCENVMYNLCERASPKVSRILVSVISQLKNNGVEELDAILEHLQLVAANVSSEMVIGLQTEEELEVVTEGIERFTTLGNTLLKRDDLEIDLHRLSRFQEAAAFYEKAYISAISSPLVKGFKKGGVEEATIPVGTETDADGIPVNPEGIEASSADLPPAPMPENSLDGLPETPGVIGGVSDNLPGAMDNIGDVDDVPPVSMAPMPSNQMGMAEPPSPEDMAALGAAQDADVAELGASPLPPDMGGAATQFSPEDLDKIAATMAQQYQSGQISPEADFMEALMNCEAANGLCENLGTMSEEQVYEVAQRVQTKLGEFQKVHNLDTGTVDAGIEHSDYEDDSEPTIDAKIIRPQQVTADQLQEAIEILSSSIKLTNEELKDL